VEFGAGGSIVQAEAEVRGTAGEGAGAEAGGTGEGGGGDGGNGEGAGGPSTAPPAIPTNPIIGTGPNNRRKRKAKGWFCPVCRQPYTSLLRITTSPPTKDGKDIDNNRDSTSSDGLDPTQVPNQTSSTTTNPATSNPTTTPTPAAAAAATPRGALASLRPAFLRGMSRSSPLNSLAEQAEPAVPILPRDVERGPETSVP